MYPGLTEGRRAFHGVWGILAETCFYCTILDSSARSAIVFRFLLLQKERGRGAEPHYSVLSTVTPHGVRQKKKALRGEEGGKQEFSPQQHYKSVQILLQNSPLDCFLGKSD